MANTLLSLLVKIGGDTSELRTALDEAESTATKSTSNIVSGLSSIGGAVVLGGIAAAGAAVVGLGAFLSVCAKDASGMQDVQVQLAQVLKNTGVDSGVTAKQIYDLGDSFAKTTKFSDLMVVSAGAVLARFDMISKDTMPRAMQVSADLATTLGIDLSSAAQMLGKALESPGTGLLRLKMAGVTFSKAQTKVITDLVNTGHVAEAQAAIMDALQNSIGGVAQAAGTTLSGRLAILGNSFQGMKESIGEKLLPLLTQIADAFSAWLASPAVQAGIKTITEGIGKLADWLGVIFDDLVTGGIGVAFDDLRESLVGLVPQFVLDAMTALYKGIAGFIELLKTNKGVVVAIFAMLGATIAAFVYTTVIPAAIDAVVAMAPIIAVLALVGAAAYLLYQAWTNNWGGIQEKLAAVWAWLQPIFVAIKTWLEVNIPIAIQTLKTFWETVLLPAIQKVWNWVETVLFPMMQDLWNWLATNVPIAIQTLVSFWQTVLLPAIQAVWGWITTVLFPMLKTLWDWLATNVPAAIQTLTNFWTTVLWPAIQAVWGWMSSVLFPFLQTLAEFLGAVLGLAITALAGLWQNVLWPALQNVWTFIKDNVLPIFVAIVNYINVTFIPIIGTLANWIGSVLAGAFGAVSGAIRAVTGWLQTLIDKLKNIKLPSWLTPGSPTPFELGLRGIGSALADLSRTKLPAFQMELNAVGSTAGTSNQNINNYYNLAIHSNARTEPVAADFALMKSLYSPGV